MDETHYGFLRETGPSIFEVVTLCGCSGAVPISPSAECFECIQIYLACDDLLRNLIRGTTLGLTRHAVLEAKLMEALAVRLEKTCG